jgi:hypothetical protein
MLEELADWDWARGEWVVGGEEEPKDEGREEDARLDVGEFMALRKGKEEDMVETGGTGKEGENEDPREEERGSGRLLVRLRFGDPAKGLCLMFLSTLR